MSTRITTEGINAWVQIMLGLRQAETLELRLSSAPGFDPAYRAHHYPECHGVIGYSTQLIRQDEWTCFDGEAFAPARSWRLLPGPTRLFIFNAVLVGLHSDVLYAVQPLDPHVTLDPDLGGGVELEIAPHLLLRALLEAAKG